MVRQPLLPGFSRAAPEDEELYLAEEQDWLYHTRWSERIKFHRARRGSVAGYTDGLGCVMMKSEIEGVVYGER